MEEEKEHLYSFGVPVVINWWRRHSSLGGLAPGCLKMHQEPRAAGIEEQGALYFLSHI